MIRRAAAFVFLVAYKVKEEELLALSNELAYKLLLSFFPFVIFLAALFSFLELGETAVVMQFFYALPAEIAYTVETFINEPGRSGAVLSVSLLVAMYSASNGFRAVLKAVNRAHGQKDTRNFFKKAAVCFGLMLIFSLALVVMLLLWVFSENILTWLGAAQAVHWGAGVIAWLVLVTSTALMYRIACVKNNRKVLAGAVVTVSLWALSSEIFVTLVQRFSNIPVIYGSIAGVFMLIIWLNIVAFVLLLGNVVNAILSSG